MSELSRHLHIVPYDERSGEPDPQLVFKKILKEIEFILDRQPLERMWVSVARYLLRLKLNLDQQPPDVQAFVQGHLLPVLDILRDQASWRERTDAALEPNHVRSVAGQEALHAMADHLAEHRLEHRETEIRQIGWDQILEDGEHFQMSEKHLENGEKVNVLHMRIGADHPWHEFIIPPNEQLMHKGGASRVLLKIFAGAPMDLIIPELPVNDVDAVGCGEKTEIQRGALMMGADIEGIEMVENFDNMRQLLLDRDMDMNQAFLTHEGLVFTEAAMRAARTGNITLGEGDRGIYGSEVLYFDRVPLAKNRGSYRLMKMVVEGKARSFEYTPLNKQIDLGIYWLVLARKFAKKKNAGALLRRFYDLGKQMGQTREGEEDIYAVLDRVHEDYPFFRFDEAKMDEAGHMRWLARKLFRVAERSFRRERGFPSGLHLEREPFDEVPFTACLFQDQPVPEREREVVGDWPDFEERCRERSEGLERIEVRRAA